LIVHVKVDVVIIIKSVIVITTAEL
jgi:hypothetical protein